MHSTTPNLSFQYVSILSYRMAQEVEKERRAVAPLNLALWIQWRPCSKP